MAEPNIKAVRLDERLIHGQGPESVGIRFFSLAETIDKIFKAAPRQTIFIIVKTPQDALKLAEGGVPIKALNVGNIHMKDGKTRLTNFISVDADDLNALRTLHEKYHANVNTRTTPLGNDVGSDFDLNDYVATH